MLYKIVCTMLLMIFPLFSIKAEEVEKKQKIGLLIVATGKYSSFIPSLIQSARNFFCPEHQVTYFVFTDQPLDEAADVVRFEQKRLGWPYDTMMRYKIYLDHWEHLKEQDYLFACDADMLFTGYIGDEILSERVATLHPGFLHQQGSYECNPLSTAYVPKFRGKSYFAGGFYGAKREAFLHILKTNNQHIEEDLAKGIIAVWHDESHWNRYCIDFPPTCILSPAYCYPENADLPYEKKLLALDKNHDAFRK
mgnify:CR=1 FL=1